MALQSNYLSFQKELFYSELESKQQVPRHKIFLTMYILTKFCWPPPPSLKLDLGGPVVGSRIIIFKIHVQHTHWVTLVTMTECMIIIGSFMLNMTVKEMSEYATLDLNELKKKEEKKRNFLLEATSLVLMHSIES